MSTGKNTISYRKKNTPTQTNLGVGVTKLIFGHKAAGGESQLNIFSLTDPDIEGFVQPTLSALQEAKIFYNRNNMTIQSTLRGTLMNGISYSVANNTVIVFNGFTLEEDEVLLFTVDPMVRSGLQMVDGRTSVDTDELAIGETLFPCEAFEYNANPNKQIGAVEVHRNGQLQYRCENNDISNPGNYIEVPPNGGTLTSYIQFKTAPITTPDAISVKSTGALIWRPSESQLGTLETLAGQVDKLVDVVADVSGLEKSTFQANPNHVDLRNFGDIVLSLRSDLDKMIAVMQTPAQVGIRANAAWGSGSSVWADATSVTVDPGIYNFWAHVMVTVSGGSHWYAGISTTSGNVSPTAIDVSPMGLTTNGYSANITQSLIRVIVPVTTTYYLKIMYNSTGGTCGGKLIAEKVGYV